MSTINRRDFLKNVGIAGTAATAAACTYDYKVPVENVLPYVTQPEDVLPGTPTYYSSACDECSARCGTIIRNKDGRAVMVEGNPDHPEQNGLCTRGHFGLMATYSPDRLEGPTKGGQKLSWEDADKALMDGVSAARAAGKKVAWLGRYRNGSVATLLDQLVAGMGLSRVHWELLGAETLLAASKAAFGKDALPVYELAEARTILSFGMDFLGTSHGTQQMRKGWAKAKNPRFGEFVTRLVCVEPHLGATSSQADLWLAPNAGTEAKVALAIAKLAAEKKGYVGPASALVGGIDVDGAASESGIAKEKLEEIAGWLAADTAVVLPGGHANQSKDGTALAIATLLINEVIGAVGKTVVFGREHKLGQINSYNDVKALLADASAGKVGVLFVDGLNPVFNLPAEDKAAEALSKVDLLVQLANEPDESSNKAALILPPGTSLEVWGDAEAISGVHVLQQPGMTARKSVRSIGDMLLALGKSFAASAPPAPTAVPATPVEGTLPVDGVLPAAPPAPAASLGFDFPNFREFIKARWKREVLGANDFENAWVQALQRGGHFEPVRGTGAAFSLSALPAVEGALKGGDKSLVVFPSTLLHDGRHANIPWAQELPDPISTYAWTSWVELNPKTVAKLGLGKTDLVSVTVGGASIKLGYFASPGIREDQVAVVLGNGRKEGRYAKNRGVDPMGLLPATVDPLSGALVLYSSFATVARAGTESDAFALCGSMNQDGRPIALAVTAEEAVEAIKSNAEESIVEVEMPKLDKRLVEQKITDMFPEPQHPTYRFGLSVDTNLCNGCMACVAACNLENNVAWVGPDQTRKGRGMSWIRMDRFFEGEGEHPDVRHMPVMCQNCSHAPCEGVCPVLATYHNLDGLNAMIYNRCVGTRYCANNCPYTARRFNYHSWVWPDSYRLMLNPDIMVREQGVMEKCQFCVQRIRSVKDSWRDMRDPAKPGSGVVPDSALQKLTACASACPSGAITFGNAKDGEGQLAKEWKDPRVYTLLGELNTKPGVRYLAKSKHNLKVEKHGGEAHGAAGKEGAEKSPENHGAAEKSEH